MNHELFHNLPKTRITELVDQAGAHVCILPLKGTRRWFKLEYPELSVQHSPTAYLNAIAQRSIEIYQMIFEHGIQTLLSPALSPDLMFRGPEYMQIAADAFSSLVSHPAFLEFYERHEVRVRFYGDYHRYLDDTPYAYLCDQFDQLTQQTLSHQRRKLFFGVFAHDPIPTLIDLTLQYYQQNGHVPNKQQLITLYYGEPVEAASLFIGFGKLRAFDMPLIATGREDLYFMISPSLYLTEFQFRDILYDHLFVRNHIPIDLTPAEVQDLLTGASASGSLTATELAPENLERLRTFYQANRQQTLGLGITPIRGIWCPQIHIHNWPDLTALHLHVEARPPHPPPPAQSSLYWGPEISEES